MMPSIVEAQLRVMQAGLDAAPKPEEPTITATPVGHRTPAEIQRQMEQRLAEMEAEALSPKYTMPCSGCKWVDGNKCLNPLLTGLSGQAVWNVDRSAQYAPLCGPEKALWQERTEGQKAGEWVHENFGLVLFTLMIGAPAAMMLLFSFVRV